jgi:predicted transcriptional regulator
MKHMSCECIVWNRLPIIRKEIGVSMINDYDLMQKETAEKLGISPATVYQYLSGK